MNNNFLSFSPYSLNIISHHKDFDGKFMHQHNIEGINTIGVYGNEEFEIQFGNNSCMQRVSIKSSLDGTDIITGGVADSNPSSQMWIVEPLSTLSLKAWPESNQGGASFIFTNSENGVATHLHSDISCRGIIGCAVFVEGNVEPVSLTYPYPYPYFYLDYYNPCYFPMYINNTCGGPFYTNVLGVGVLNNS